MLNNPFVESTFERVPEHHESHMGPYGVEMPPDWNFVVAKPEDEVDLEDGAQYDHAENGAPGLGES
jgi:hypothetical protein